MMYSRYGRDKNMLFHRRFLYICRPSPRHTLASRPHAPSHYGFVARQHQLNACHFKERSRKVHAKVQKFLVILPAREDADMMVAVELPPRAARRDAASCHRSGPRRISMMLQMLRYEFLASGVAAKGICSRRHASRIDGICCTSTSLIGQIRRALPPPPI